MALEVVISKNSGNSYRFRKLGDQKSKQWLNFQLGEVYECWNMYNDGTATHFRAYCTEISNDTVTLKVFGTPQKGEVEKPMKLSELVEEGFKYIARDQDGELYAFLEKPEKHKEVWLSFGIHRLVNKPELDFIEWEDDQPYEIAEVIEQVRTHKLKTIDTFTANEENLLALLENYLELDYSFKITPKLIKTIFGRYIVEYEVEIQKIVKDEV